MPPGYGTSFEPIPFPATPAPEFPARAPEFDRRDQAAGEGRMHDPRDRRPIERQPESQNDVRWPQETSRRPEETYRPHEQRPLRIPADGPSSEAQPAADLFEPAKVVAIVGDQYILAGDLLLKNAEGEIMGTVDHVIEPYRDKMSPAQLEAQYERLIQQLLKPAIELKVMYLDFLRTVPKDRLPEIQKQLFEQFDKDQLDKLMKVAKVASEEELDAYLRERGSSLHKQRRSFAEKLLAQEMIRRNVDYDAEITYDEMVAQYKEHAEDYEILAQAQWERMMVRFDNFPSKADAYRRLSEMGNRVLRGAPLAEVARQDSQGPRASHGGRYEGTTPGSLRSEVIDRAIFSLPIGALSRILQDEEGFHIVRVIERRAAGRVPFEEAQPKIKESIKRRHVKEQVAAYLVEARKKTRVWTILDDERSPGQTAEHHPAGSPGYSRQ